MTDYVGILDGSGDVWGVRIPDVPGCVGAGATPDAAIANVTSALRDVAEYKRSFGYEIPEPSSRDEIIATGEVEPGEATVMIVLLLDAGNTPR